MAVVLLASAVVIREAGRIHDETKGAMLLHEAVEKGRHEKRAEPERLAEEWQERAGLFLRFPSWRLTLREKGGGLSGKGAGGDWEYSIEIRKFRPESFLRKITLLEKLGERDEN